jgi:poly(3-hydroxybutyrate) depolymerase
MGRRFDVKKEIRNRSLRLQRFHGEKVMLRRLAIGSAVVLVLLGAVAAYLLYAPKPALPVGPIEAKAIDIGGYSRRYTVFTPSHLQAGASVLIAFHPRKKTLNTCAASSAA